jgi:hypothetical protein
LVKIRAAKSYRLSCNYSFIEFEVLELFQNPLLGTFISERWSWYPRQAVKIRRNQLRPSRDGG